MRTRILASLFGLGAVAVTVFAVACSSGDTAVKMLPADSDVTLVKVDAPDNNAEGKLYLGDTATGNVFQVKTKPDSWLSPYRWVSPTELIVTGYYQDFFLLDLSARTLHKLPGTVAGASVSFSHSGDLMAIGGPNGELMLWTTKDNGHYATIQSGPLGYVVWSPDDKHIFWPGTPAGIALVEDPSKVVPVDIDEGALSAAWLRDGTSLIFNGADGVYSVNPDTGAKTLLYSWPADLKSLPEAPKLSQDGKYVLISARDVMEGRFRAVIVPLDGGQGVQVTSVWPQDAEWSPAENVVAIVGDWCQTESRLLLLNADGTTHATFDKAMQTPRFSADGSMIAYVGIDPEGTEEGLVVRSIEGENVVAFMPGFLRDDVWSEDGRWLAYTPGPAVYQCADVSGSTQVLPFP